MALTAAEKQRRYRARHLGVDGAKERMQFLVNAAAKAQLVRLADYHGYTMTTLIETLIAEAERALIDKLPYPDIGRYLDRQLQSNRSQIRSAAEACGSRDDARASPTDPQAPKK
jgi:hypothetical protein